MMCKLKITFSVIIVSVSPIVVFSQVYSVGNDAGFSVSCYSQADSPVSIYSVGDDDGFSVSCYAQSDSPSSIYAVGNDDGFGFACVGGLGIEVPLPIELINFTADVIDGAVKLSWQTTSEMDNDYFTIEKSKTAVDWIEIKEIDGAGNSTAALNYSYVDNIPYSGVSYYRIRQTDFNGEYTYSSIRSINLMQPMVAVSIYPNPTSSVITIQAGSNELAGLTIYNSLGQDVTHLIKQLSKTENVAVIDLSNLSAGIYNVKTLTTTNIVYKQ